MYEVFCLTLKLWCLIQLLLYYIDVHKFGFFVYSPVENCKFLGKLVSSDNRYFIVDYGRLGVPEHISAGCSDCTLGENFLEAKFKMAAIAHKKNP